MSSVTNIIELQRFSSKRRLMRTVAWVLCFVHNVKSAVSIIYISIERKPKANEKNNAERLLIRDIQCNELKDEVQFLIPKAKDSSKVPIKVTSLNFSLMNTAFLDVGLS